MEVLIIVIVVVVVLALLGAALSARIIKQYEQGVLFRLGRVQGPRDPPDGGTPASVTVANGTIPSSPRRTL